MMKQQCGQVLPVGMALMALTMMGIFVLYNTGQVATDKMKLANSADAAAYSGALLQARALNFQAYSNRAMVANQVSIAQAVTLNSWVTYGAVSSENIATVLKPIPIINVLAQGVQSGLRQVDKVVSPIAQGLLSVVDSVNRGLSISQEAMFLSTFMATPDVMREVVNESDSRFSIDTAFSSLGLSKNLSDWRNFSTGYSPENADAMNGRVAMINQSRDPFTRERNWKFFKNFWLYSTPLLRHRLYREGTTELLQVDREGELYWEWKAKDTLSLHNRLWRWRGTKRYEVPIGWSESFANSAQSQRTIDPTACTTQQSFNSSDSCSRFLGMNQRAEMLADTGVRSPVSGLETRSALNGYNGLHGYRSLSSQTLEAESPTLRLKAEVFLPISDTYMSDKTDVSGSFKTSAVALGDVISSISTAEVFYQHPTPSMAGAVEHANGYSPYWAARLSPVTVADKLLATSFRSRTTTAPPTLVTTDAFDTQGSDVINQNNLLPVYLEPGSNYSSFDAVTSGYRGVAENYSEELVDDQLNQVLAASVRHVLTGVAGNDPLTLASIETLTSDSLQSATENSIYEFTQSGAETPYTDAIQEAEQQAQALNDEFRRIRTTVSDNFELAYEESSLVLDGQLADLNAEVARLRGEIENGSHNEESLNDLQQQIYFHQQEVQDLTAGLNEILARQLMDIVSEATDLYVMRYSEALYTVEEWLRSDLEQVPLPWTELFDDE